VAPDEPAMQSASKPYLLTCPSKNAPQRCQLEGDSRLGVRLLGTLLEPTLVRVGGTLDLDASGNISCVACDCGSAGGALVVDCPDLLISPGFINLHDHLSYAGTPPLKHPGLLYTHRNDWRLGENGHSPLNFSGGASLTQVLAHELRMLMGGTTSIVGSGGKPGLVRNLDVAEQTEGLLPGTIGSETFPLGDASGGGKSEACQFGKYPDSGKAALELRAYVAHLGEGSNTRARDELRCALGDLDLIGNTSAVVHAMALTTSDAERLAKRGASVVWSPRSNLDLYGATAPVALLASLGVRIALGSDWLASGSMNLLRELDCAEKYNRKELFGYFSSWELHRMVTANAAWALGLERGLGALIPGAVGDVSVFAAGKGGGDPHGKVIGAGAEEVKLVLRQGLPLYGTSEVVAAFHAGNACATLDVCSQPMRACTAETGQPLETIRAAGEAVYPLWTCSAPPDEPSCETVADAPCPAGAGECPSAADLVAPPLPDTDGDGIQDELDVCPRLADPSQTDLDQDGHGDACDGCRAPNPGLLPCATSIAQLRAPAARLPLRSSVRLSGVRVTGVRTEGSRGFHLEDGDHAPYSGIFAYTGKLMPEVATSELLQVQGYFEHYRGTDELTGIQVLQRGPVETLPYPALLVGVDAAGDGSQQAAGLASIWVRIEGVEVSIQNPDAPADFDETQLEGGLRLDDALFGDLDNTYEPGTRFVEVRGILGSSHGHQKLWPRQLSDLQR